MTPGLDGHPLAFAPINWTVWCGRKYRRRSTIFSVLKP
jgi:hypothetical protein